MSEESIAKQLSGSDLQIKPFLTATRKVGGRIVRDELEPPSGGSDEDGIDGLLEGVDSQEVDEGRRTLMADNPHMASMQLQEMMGFEENSSVAMHFMDPVRIASTKRVGSLADKETGETISFRRVGNFVELSGPNGQILHKLSSNEFSEVVATGQFDVL